MIGNTSELNDPANYLNRNNYYPNAYNYNNNRHIRHRTIYI